MQAMQVQLVSFHDLWVIILDSLHHALFIPYYLQITKLKEIRRKPILITENNQYNHVMRTAGVNMLNCNESNGIKWKCPMKSILFINPHDFHLRFTGFRIHKTNSLFKLLLMCFIFSEIMCIFSRFCVLWFHKIFHQKQW